MNRITIATAAILVSLAPLAAQAGLFGTIDSVDTLKTVAEQKSKDDRKIASDKKAEVEPTAPDSETTKSEK